VLRSYPRCDQKTAIPFVDYALERLPFPVQVIQTDNCAEFQSAFSLPRPRQRRRPPLNQTPNAFTASGLR
jgi:hypothetical protein